MIDQEFRPLSDWERNLLMRMADQEFPGREELLQQLQGVEVQQIDEHGPLGCLIMRVTSPVLLPIISGPIIQASYMDANVPVRGTTFIPRVRILLHVQDRRVVHLEIYKDDDTEILRRPDLSELEVYFDTPPEFRSL